MYIPVVSKYVHVGISQSARKKKSTPSGNIFILGYIVPTAYFCFNFDNLQITYRDLPTRFSSFFCSFVEIITCIIRKLKKNYI